MIAIEFLSNNLAIAESSTSHQRSPIKRYDNQARSGRHDQAGTIRQARSGRHDQAGTIRQARSGRRDQV
jgi:hypothetical protein